MIKNEIEIGYFNWMYDMVCRDRLADGISYKKLLTFLHEVEFTHTIQKDRSRVEDGLDLRYRFPYETYGVNDSGQYLDGPCSIFEMMLALAIRCEETIMDNPAYGDRTGQWFWNMISSLGLSSMEDSIFDMKKTKEIVTKFLNREYEPTGKGGLFTIRDCKEDLRTIEIWTQMLWYLNTIT